MKNHPIQLIKLNIKQLNVVIDDLSVTEKESLDVHLTYKVGFNDFNEEEKILAVGFKCLLNEEIEDAPFKITVELIGIFTVGDEFPFDKVEHFAKHNAPIILMPYIRENIYALSARTGINIILPLVQVPTKI